MRQPTQDQPGYRCVVQRDELDHARREPWPVVAAVAVCNGAVLLGRRASHKRYGGLWEFPGGKLESYETLASAVARELREELDVTVVDVGDAVYSVQDPGSSFVISFVPVRIVGAPTCREHDAICWATLADLTSLPLAPSDHQFALAVAAGAVHIPGVLAPTPNSRA